MQIDEVRTHLTTLKVYMNKVEEFMRQASGMIYEIEEKLMDIEDELHYQKYGPKTNIKNLNEAATQTFCPARLVGIDRCSEEDNALAAFIQQFSCVNTLISKRR